MVRLALHSSLSWKYGRRPVAIRNFAISTACQRPMHWWHPCQMKCNRGQRQWIVMPSMRQHSKLVRLRDSMEPLRLCHQFHWNIQSFLFCRRWWWIVIKFGHIRLHANRCHRFDSIESDVRQRIALGAVIKRCIDGCAERRWTNKSARADQIPITIRSNIEWFADTNENRSSRKRSHPFVAIFKGIIANTTDQRHGHTLVGSYQRCFQNWGFGSCGTSLGSPQKSTGHELRQIVTFHSSILQKRYYEKDRTFTAFGLSILSSVQYVRWDANERVHSKQNRSYRWVSRRSILFFFYR